MRRLPTGTVTLLFTDIAGSTRLLERLGPDVYMRALTDQRRLLRAAVAAHGGVEVEMQGDSFHFAFQHACQALDAAVAAQRSLAEHEWEAEPIRVRMGLHTGRPVPHEDRYAGADVHEAARVMAAGHGGQVLLSETTAGLVERAVRDLGPHWLRDLSHPLRLYQLGDGDFPPLKSLNQTNLPAQATPFLGREREVAELRDLLLQDHPRLVTLTGPGGTGKTRLALQAAADVAGRFPDGVWWVPLEALRDPELVVPLIAQTLRARGELEEYVRQRHLLLVLDNLEQIVGVASTLATLLAASPKLRVLATSRERLHLSAEHEFSVAPLVREEAVRFFLARARAMGAPAAPGPAVEELCARLDDLPLALELAAARVRLLPPERLLERLTPRLPVLTGGPRDAPERQRTLRATIQWSHDLLSAEEQNVFRRLAVFAGGFTLEAADAVAAAEMNTIASLVDKSLLRANAARYAPLEAIREFALELLVASGEEPMVRRMHAEYVRALAERPAAMYLGPHSETWLDELDMEHENGRAALEWLLESGDVAKATRLANDLAVVWERRGRVDEGRRLLRRVLAAEPEAMPHLRATALLLGGRLAYVQDDRVEERALLEASLALFEECGDLLGATCARAELAWCSLADQRLDEADALAARALSDARTAKVGAVVWYSVLTAGGIAGEQGRHDEARRLGVQALTLARELQHSEAIVRSLMSLGWLEVLVEEYGAAKERFEAAFELMPPGDLEMRASALGNLGLIELFAGRAETARPHLVRAAALAGELGAGRMLAEAVTALAGAAAAMSAPQLAAELLSATRGLHDAYRTTPSSVEVRIVQRYIEPAVLTRPAADAPLPRPLTVPEALERVRHLLEALGDVHSVPAPDVA